MSDDGWDDGPSDSVFSKPQSNGFGASSGGGFGFGRGRGSVKNDSDGFGNGDSGFGKSSGFGGGFGDSKSDGGGFGGFGSKSGGGRGGGCYNCGEDGHMSRDCPTKSAGGRGGGGSRACFKCGEEGHMSRECPSSGGGGGGGSRACFKCGEEGHMSRECPSSGGGGGGGRGCYKCGEEGHMARDCPSADSGGGRGGGSRACFKCGEEGHMSRECPGGGGSSGGFGKPSGGFGAPSGGFGAPSGGFGAPSGGFGAPGGGGKGGGDSGGSGCRNCGEEGHFARECPEPKKSSGGCYRCGEEGHIGRDCPNNEGGGKTLDPDRPPPYVPPPPPETEEEIFAAMEKGINFDKYDYIPVEVSGNQKPAKGIDSFAEAELSEKLQENVRRAKYEKPTPIQKWAIPIIMGGRDLMGCAQTGSGKTAAFLLPVLTGMIRDGVEGGAFSESQTPAAIVVGPTRELVMQIYNEARKFSHGTVIRPVVVYGGTSVGHQLRQVEQGAHMVVGTPGRLLDFINRGKISLSKVRYLILDEADRMLDMGFEPEVRKMVEQLGMPEKSKRQTLMFSATFPEEIQKLAADFLNDYLFCTVGRVGAANTDIAQSVYEVTEFDKRDKLVSILNESGTDRTLVFVETKRNADFLASFLSQSEFPTTSIHGDRQQREREEALRDFKSGKAPVLIATSVAARGLDIPGVKHVVNYNLPSNIQEYVHRIGRTGRCGNTGKATSFFDPDKDAELARSLIKILQDATQEVPAWLEEMGEKNLGAGFDRGGGKFGGRDQRRGKFGGGGGGNDDFGGSGGGGGFGAGSSAGDGGDEEEWD